MGKDVVVNGATIECTGSPQTSFLVVPPSLLIEIDGANSANIDHHVPFDNILPFGPCILQPGQPPCVPLTPTPWSRGEASVVFGRKPVLDIKSKCKCARAPGVISIVSSGQSNPFFSVDGKTSPYATLWAEWDARQRYAAQVKAQMDAENEADQRELDEGSHGFWGNFASTGLDLVPGAGWVKGVIEAADGRDLVTRKKLKWWERALGAIPGGKYFKKGGDVVGAGRKAIRGGGEKAGERAAREAAKETAEKASRLSPERRRHILDGDGVGGGHGTGRGIPGKSEFPPRWSDDQTIKHVNDVVRDPNSRWTQQTGRPGATHTKNGDPVTWQVDGTRDGVDVRVITQPDGEGIVTAFPTNTKRNP